MRRKPGDIIYTYRINVSEIARTNTSKAHPLVCVVEALKTLLRDLEPAVTERSVTWNGVDAGGLSISIVPERRKR